MGARGEVQDPPLRVGIGAATLAFGWLKMGKSDRSLPDVMAGRS